MREISRPYFGHWPEGTVVARDNVVIRPGDELLLSFKDVDTLHAGFKVRRASGTPIPVSDSNNKPQRASNTRF